MKTLPPAVLKALPAHATCEQEWMNALLLALPHLAPVHLHRQNAGTVVAKRGGVVKGAPVGAADLTGWTCGGLRVEIEAKMPGEKLSPAQRRWQHACIKWGVLHIVARYCDAIPLLNNVAVIAAAIGVGLAARGVQP